MKFDGSLRQRWMETGGRWSFEVPDGWMQGRAVFGGLVAAAAVALAKRHLDAGWRLRSTSVQFLRPAKAGTLHGTFSVRRQGKGTTFAEVVLSQAGSAVFTSSLILVRPREGALTLEAPRFIEKKPATDSIEMPYIEGVTPEFVKQVALRWADGAMPFAGADAAAFSGHCRFRCPAGDVEGVVGLLDVWPCPSLSVLKVPTMASSVSWTAHVISVPESFDGWFGFEYETVVGAGGYHTAVGRLHSPQGALVGWTEQLVVVFA